MSVEGLVNVPVGIEDIARVLARHRDFRVLRRMQEWTVRRGGNSDGSAHRCLPGCRDDGSRSCEDRIIELAMQRFRADEEGA